MNYSKWNPGEPNGGTWENCVHLIYNSYSWNDISCLLSLDVMCEVIYSCYTTATTTPNIGEFATLKIEGLLWTAKSFSFLFIVAQCTTSEYHKSNGDCACAFLLPGTMSWSDANSQCLEEGARLPEIFSEAENADIFQLQVCVLQHSIFTKLINQKMLRDHHTARELRCNRPSWAQSEIYNLNAELPWVRQGI